MIIDSPVISGSLDNSGSLSQLGNITITGSLTVTGDIVGNITGSASSASQAVSASYSLSSSYAATASYAANVPETASYASFANTASYALTASYISGSGMGVGFPFSGAAVITGSLLVTNLTGSGVQYLVSDVDGNITAQTAPAAIKTTQAVISTAGQTSFNITNGYSTGLVDVFINGTKLSNAEFTDTNGTTITLATGSNVDDVVEFVKYLPASGVSNNVLRQLTSFTATGGQTVFSASYTPGLLDIYYNGARLTSTDYTANNGVSIALATASVSGDILDVMVYSYQVGAMSGIGGQGTAGQIAYFGTSNAITGSPNFSIVGNTINVTGSLIVSGSGTFTNIGPAVFSGSVTAVGGFSGTASFASTASSADNFLVRGNLTAQTLIVQTVTSSVVYSSGSNVFGNSVSNTHQFTGSVYVTGSVTTTAKSQALNFFSVGSLNSTDGSFFIDHPGINTWKIGVSNANTSTFSIGNDNGGAFVSKYFNIINNGNIGIGTINPDTKLHISASDGIKIQATGNSDTPSLTIINNTNQYGWARFGGGLQGNGKGYANISCWNASTVSEVMRISGDGYVGIGINPSYRLDISRGSSGVVLNLDGTNAYDAETGILMSSGRAKISGFLNTGGGTPGTSLRFYTMPDDGSMTERVRILSGGNVGIGTTSPNAILQVQGQDIYLTGNTDNRIRFSNYGFTGNSMGAAIGYIYGVANTQEQGNLAFYTNPNYNSTGNLTERMRITSAGKVGIGITNPESLLDVTDSSANTLMLVKNTSTANSTGKNAMYGFGGTDTVGTPKACGGMQAVPNDVNWVNGYLYWYVRAGDGQALRMSLTSGGALTISGALTQNGSPSDINLKENLAKISSPLEKISQINGYTFEWKEGSPARGNVSNIVEDAGVIAQEIETIMPEIVRMSDDNKVVNYNGIIALLIEGMKEQQTLIQELQEKLERNNIT